MGKTILISSHILHELAELCNVVGIIERGKLLYSGPVSDILRRARVGHVLHIAVADRTPEAAQVLKAITGVKKITIVEEPTSAAGINRAVIHLTLDSAAKTDISDIPNILVNQGFRLIRFDEEPVNLETAFMRLTKGLVQ